MGAVVAERSSIEDPSGLDDQGSGHWGDGGLPKTLVSLERNPPSLEDDEAIRAVEVEQARDYSWAAEQGWTVEFWGPKRVDARVRTHDRFRIIGPSIPTGRLSIPAKSLIAWLIHFLLTIARPRAGILVTPTPISGAGAAAACALRRRRPPLIVRVQSRPASKALMVHGSSLRAKAMEAAERFTLRRADLVVPMGRYTTERALEAGVPEEKILVLPFPTSWRDSSPQQALNQEKDDQLVVCAARLEREKGIDVLLSGFVHVLADCPQARLRIAGDGPARPELERLARRLGIDNHVEFLGWLEPTEMPELFGPAAIGVLPSRWEEGLGMALVEAGLAGCALVASDLGGMRDIVRPGLTGLLVPPEDDSALADALTQLLTRPEERARYGSYAQQAASEYLGQRETAMREFSERMNTIRSRW
jgi:glycosyltransferase involved in cell wall biosynthesis